MSSRANCFSPQRKTFPQRFGLSPKRCVNHRKNNQPALPFSHPGLVIARGFHASLILFLFIVIIPTS